ncbi:uncharacterized protein FFB20_10995 [Fusarium fujikuroi]|nr:uncharacterized protein FFB20_10995 [Fusarium fujikuroi]SCO25555.1 uncharacterized protein FFC1_15586 [Fusarium fujikuroi]
MSVALCVSLYLGIRVQARVRRTFHGVVGIIGILGGMVHLLQSTASLLLGLSIIVIGATGIHGLWRPSSIENAALKRNGKQYVELKVRVPDSKHNFYIKSRGTIYRVAWATGQDNSQHEATILLPLSAIEDGPGSRTIRDKVRVTCDGLFRAPLSPYTYLAKDLDIISADSGIFEGYSCFKWRQRLLEPKDSLYFKSRLFWFTTRSYILSPFFDHLRNELSSWKAGYTVAIVILMGDQNPFCGPDLPPLLTGKLTIDHDTKTCMRSAISQYLEKNPSHAKQYFVGESLRSLL